MPNWRDQQEAYKEINNLECSIARDQTGPYAYRGGWGCLPGCGSFIFWLVAALVWDWQWLIAGGVAIVLFMAVDKLYEWTHPSEMRTFHDHHVELAEKKKRFRTLHAEFVKKYGNGAYCIVTDSLR